MSRALVTIRGSADRAKVTTWAAKAPYGTRVEFKKAKRSLPQNDKMWACLTDISSQMAWHGLHLTPDEWKVLFLDLLDREYRIVPSLDGTGVVNLGRSSSDLSKQEFSDLLECIHAFGARHGVTFNEPPTEQPAEVAA